MGPEFFVACFVSFEIVDKKSHHKSEVLRIRHKSNGDIFIASLTGISRSTDQGLIFE